MTKNANRRHVLVLLVVGVLLLPLACNMPAPVSQPGDSESETAWNWLEFIRGIFNSRNPTGAESPSPDPFMLSVNNALATQAAAGVQSSVPEAQAGFDMLPSDFTCEEKSGFMVSYLDTFPTSPSEDSNSLVTKSFVFTLQGNPQLDIGDPFSIDFSPYMKFYMDWELYARILAPVVRTNADGTRELESYIDRELSEQGEGDGVLFDNGLFYGEMDMRSASRDDGKIYGEREYGYYAAGMYDANTRDMLLCLSWNEIPEASLQQVPVTSPISFASWCGQAGLNYFICTPVR